MKILMFTHYFYPRIGGVEKVVEKLCQNLQDHEITIITEKHEKDLKDVEKFNDWTTVYRLTYPHKKYIGLLYIWKWMCENRRLIQEADLVHIHDVFIWYLPFRFLFPFKPVYMTYHGWEGKLPISWNSLVQKKLAWYLSKRTMVVGRHLEKFYEINADVVSYNGVEIPKKLEKKVDNNFIYVGRLSEETGLHLVLKTLDKMPKVKIEFIGDGELRSKCERFGKVHGFVKDISPFLTKAEYCFAGGILNIQEAMANKCLVLVMYHNEIKKDYFEMAPFAKHIVIENSPIEMAKRIVYYQKYNKEQQRLVENGYEWAERQTWQKVSDQYKRLWRIKE